MDEDEKIKYFFHLDEDVVKLLQQLALEMGVSEDEWLYQAIMTIHYQRHQVWNTLTKKHDLIRCGRSTCFVQSEEQIHHIWEARRKSSQKVSTKKKGRGK